MFSLEGVSEIEYPSDRSQSRRVSSIWDRVHRIDALEIIRLSRIVGEIALLIGVEVHRIGAKSHPSGSLRSSIRKAEIDCGDSLSLHISLPDYEKEEDRPSHTQQQASYLE